MQRFESEDETMRRENDEQEAFERKRNKLHRQCECHATTNRVAVEYEGVTYHMTLCGTCDIN